MGDTLYLKSAYGLRGFLQPLSCVLNYLSQKLKVSFFSRGEDETEAWQEYVDRIFPKFETMVEAGALIWNFDCQYASWSMKGLQENMQVQWDL